MLLNEDDIADRLSAQQKRFKDCKEMAYCFVDLCKCLKKRWDLDAFFGVNVQTVLVQDSFQNVIVQDSSRNAILQKSTLFIKCTVDVYSDPEGEILCNDVLRTFYIGHEKFILYNNFFAQVRISYKGDKIVDVEYRADAHRTSCNNKEFSMFLGQLCYETDHLGANRNTG